MGKSVNILVILPNNLGDIIMTTPVLEGLKAKYPDSHLTFFVESGFEGGIQNNHNIDKIFLFKRRSIRDSFLKGEWNTGSREFIDALKQLTVHEYEVIINLSQHSYTSNLIPLLKVKSIRGCHFLREGNDSLSGEWTQYLYAIPFARGYNSLHAADVYRRIAGVSCHRGGYTINVTTSEKEEAGEYLRKIGVDSTSKKIIVFQPGAAFAAKRWPVEHYVKLGRMLIQKGWQVIISGAPSEKEIALTIQQEIGENSFSTAGDTKFRQAIANLCFAQGCVTADTALMHAAAALDVKTYALFGTTNPVETGPYGNDHFIFSGKCEQKPCFSNKCESMLCMKSILPETVCYCIENGSVPPQPQCDIYKTAIKENGDYHVVPLVPDAFPYYNSAGALLTQKIFGDDSFKENYSQEDLNIYWKKSKKFIEIVTRMEELLHEFLKENDIERIRDFEKCKNDLSSLTGIGCFWTALVNLRLNSIPMLDPAKGVRMSAEVCSSTRKQIQAAFSP